MTYKTASSKEVVLKVMRDLNVQNDNFVLDALEWIGEALEHIGCGANIEDKIAVVQTTSHSAALPAGLYSLVQVGYNPEDYEKVPEKNDSPAHPGKYVDQSLIGDVEDYERQTFFVSGGYIKTSFPAGYLAVGYSGISVDADGYPLIPDDISFREAFFWYIFKKMIMRGENPNPTEFNYLVAEQQWMKYCTQARNAHVFPDISQYQNFAENWVSLLPDHSAFSRMFDDTGYGSRTIFGLGNWQDVFEAYNTTQGPIATLEIG